MEKRHQDLLTTRLEDAAKNGCSHVTWNELYHWYGVQRLAAGTWRDIVNRWAEITEGNFGGLMVVEGRGGYFLLGEKALQRVDDWCKK